MVENKRVLFLRSNPIDPDPRVEKAASTLAEAGYQVRILGWDRTATLKKLDRLDQIPIQRLMIQSGYGTGMRNFPALFRWQWGLLRWLIHHRGEVDIIHACDFDTVLPTLLLKFLWRKLVIYDIFDFYADHLRATPQWIKGLIRYVDRKCIGWADGVILVDDARVNQIEGAHPKRYVVINNTPKDIFAPLSRGEKSSKKGTLHLVYVGLLQVERGIFEILNVLQRHPNWTLSLAGFGGDEASIREKASKMENVTWCGRVEYDQALEISHQADVLFATYDPSILNHRYASPNKVFEAMMLGKPIVVARGTNVDRIIEEFQCGLVVEYGDIEALEKALTTLSKDQELFSKLARNARKAYESKYSWLKMETRLSEFYAAIQS